MLRKLRRFISIERLFYNFVKITGALPVFVWFRLRRLYQTPEARRKLRGAAVVVCNHSSMSDPLELLAVLWYRRPMFLMAEEVANTRLRRWFFARCGCISINRENPNMRTFRQINEALLGGRLLCVFSEGGIQKTGEIQTFKSGAVMMAYFSRAPIVPIYLSKRTRWWKRAACVFGEPIDVYSAFGEKPPTLSQVREFSEKLRNIEIQLSEVITAHERHKRAYSVNSPA
jgi:1-acyl-sn-glycerol-3-phosphate acyltransferase